MAHGFAQIVATFPAEVFLVELDLDLGPPAAVDLVEVGAEDSTLHKWRRALEAAGVEFIDPDAKSDEGGAGVRLRGAKAK